MNYIGASKLEKIQKNKGLVPVSHKNIIYPTFGKEQTAKGGVVYGVS